MDPLLFVHIPKTAGTSFRKGAEECFGSHRTLKDYGEESEQTSREIQQWVYGNYDPYILKTVVRRDNVKFMTGYYKIDRYKSIFSIEHTVSFLRNPLDRILSAYNHNVNYNGFNKGIEDFIMIPDHQDKQSKFLAGVPLESIGFLGISECYSDSLSLINQKFNVNIQNLQLNKGNYSGVSHITENLKDQILSVNSNDTILYERVRQMLSLRLEMHSQNLPYVRGLVTEYKNARCFGWACFDSSDEPVGLEIYKKNKRIGYVSAVDWRPYLAAFGIRRSGHVGFSFHVGELTPDDLLEVRVQSTGQVLESAPGFLARV